MKKSKFSVSQRQAIVLEEYNSSNEHRKKELIEIYWEAARKDIIKDYNIIIITE